MPSFPYFGFPFSPYRRYNYNSFNGNNNLYKQTPVINTSVTNKTHLDEEIPPKSNTSKDNISKDNYLFDLFGLKLYFDDILLVCLIFFLYNEGVKYEGLFLALILLLLT